MTNYIIFFGFLAILSFHIYKAYTLNQNEHFNVCQINHADNVFGSKIMSLNLFRNRYDFEFSIDEFNAHIQSLINVRISNDDSIISMLNKLRKLKLSRTEPFEMIRFQKKKLANNLIKYDCLIYREAKAYGVHIIIFTTNQKITKLFVKGLVLQYEIYSHKYSKRNTNKHDKILNKYISNLETEFEKTIEDVQLCTNCSHLTELENIKEQYRKTLDIHTKMVHGGTRTDALYRMAVLNNIYEENSRLI